MMAPEREYQLPKWAPRLKKPLIERLYTSSSDGRLDDILVDEVGYGLYARCESMLEVTEYRRTGRLKCPLCATTVYRRSWGPDEALSCPSCEWACPARVYNKTHSRKNLGTGGLDHQIRDYMRSFEKARSPEEKLILIDTLIHRFHWSSTQGRPIATSFIEGSMKSTMAFLDAISYGERIPQEASRTREEWRRIWNENEWACGRGQ